MQARLLSGLLAAEVRATRAARSAELALLRCEEQLLEPAAWHGLLAREEARCAPLATPASVVSLDVRSCPPAGQAHVAQVLFDRRRPSDAVARTGPCSYAVLLPETPAAAAAALASRVVLHLQERGVAATCGVGTRTVASPLPAAWRTAELVRRSDAGELRRP